MPRITKDPDVRREELLDIAFQLLRSDGFEAMSVAQVTTAAGVAKGTFYHYFASKDELAEQLVGRFGESLFEHLSVAVAGAGGSGADRLGRLMVAAAAYKGSQADIGYATFLYRPENFALRHRLYDAWRERARAVLLPVVEQGCADGSFDVTDAAAATDLVLLLWFDAADHLWTRAVDAGNARTFAETMVAGAASITQAQERILGVPAGSYQVAVPAELLPEIEKLYHERLQ